MINWKKYFTFRKNDRVGFLILFSISLLLVLANFLLPFLVKNELETDFSEFSTEIDSFLMSLTPIETEYVSRLDSFIIARYDTLDLFKFNPNTVTDSEWILLGLTQKQIKTINNYRNKGGHFTVKDDFRKIYGIRARQFAILKPYIDLPEVEPLANKATNSKSNKNSSVKLFNFDPNTVTAEELAQLGFYNRQINMIIKYRNKGGKFYKKEDLKKIYSISEKNYLFYEPYITIPQKQKDTIIKVQKKQKNIPIVDINTADTAMLKKLPLIGKILSLRIVEYRTKLGGYISIEQISEVYRLKPETFSKIKQYLTISDVKIIKININFANYYDLVKHPYINSTTANKILKYRQKNGFYSSIEDLSNKQVIEPDIFEQIKNYITVD